MAEPDAVTLELAGGWTLTVAGVRREKNGDLTADLDLARNDDVVWADRGVLNAAAGRSTVAQTMSEAGPAGTAPGAEEIEKALLDVLQHAQATLQAGQAGNVSAASWLVKLARDRYTLGVSEAGEPFAVANNGPHVVRLLRGDQLSLRGEMARAYYDAFARPVHQNALADAMATLEAFARQAPAERLHLRVAEHRAALWLDMGDETGRAVKLTAEGWSLVEEPPVRFKRTPLTGPLPEPVRGGTLDDLWGWCNVPAEDKPLVVAWLVLALYSNVPHPVLGLFGEQGSGKSSTARALTRLLDDGPVVVRKPPRDADSWVTAAAASWVVTLDNVSSVSGWLSDTLCRAVTGDGDVRRRLYTDSDLATFAFRRVLVLTGIDLGGLPGDLADRLLPVNLEPIGDEDRRDEASMSSEAWAATHPRVLGALLDLTVDVMRLLPDATLERLPRMADYARVLRAVDLALGTSGLEHYMGSRGRLAADSLSADPFIGRLQEVVTERFEGTAADLLALVTPAGEGRAPKRWPANPRIVSQRMRRHAPDLRRAGWRVEDDKGANKAKSLQWTLVPPTNVEAQGSSPAIPATPAQGSPSSDAQAGSAGKAGKAGQKYEASTDAVARQRMPRFDTPDFNDAKED